MLHNVAIVRDQDRRHAIVGCAGSFTRELTQSVFPLNDDRQLHEARDITVQNSEAVSPRPNVLERLIEQVRRHHIAYEAADVELVKPKLAFALAISITGVRLCVLSPGLRRQDDIRVVIPVAPASRAHRASSRKAEVDPVVEALVGSVDRTVVVHHRRVALVDVLRRVIEHVVVEPMSAHGLHCIAGDWYAPVFAPAHLGPPSTSSRVTRNILRKARTVVTNIAGTINLRRGRRYHEFLSHRARSPCQWVFDRISASQLHRPVVVIELPRQEVGLGITV